MNFRPSNLSLRDYKPVNLQKTKTDVLIVHCSDPRFQDAYRKLIGKVTKYYDLVVFPGASKAIASNRSVVDNIVLLHSLHHFKTIHIFDHVQCGAFGKIDDERGSHKEMLDAAKESLKKVLPDVTIVGHLVGQKQTIKL